MKFLSRTLRPLLLAVAISCTLIPIGAMAGFKEGEAAYVKGDYANALKELKPLATKGNAKAQNNLGLMYENGNGVAWDYKEAARLYGLAAAQGNAKAQNNLGLMYGYGYGVARDYKEAARLYGLAAAQGNADAQNNLWAMHEKGRGVAQGNAVAQNNLGVRYYNGQGVAQDHKEAARLFGLAAAQGNADAQNNLGVMYENGQGVAQDYKEAAWLFGLAAAQGNAVAQNNLGAMHEKGRGVAQGNAVAQNNLGQNLAVYSQKGSDLAAAARADMGRELNRSGVNTANPDDGTNAGVTASYEYARKKAAERAAAGEAKAQQSALPDPLDSIARQQGIVNGEVAASSDRDDAFPARPAKRSGIVSCNTSCVNASCMRTYDDGRKVRFQAKQVYDPFSRQWKFDSGKC